MKSRRRVFKRPLLRLKTDCRVVTDWNLRGKTRAFDMKTCREILTVFDGFLCLLPFSCRELLESEALTKGSGAVSYTGPFHVVVFENGEKQRGGESITLTGHVLGPSCSS